MSVGKLMDDGKFLEAMERALYAKLLDKLDSDAWDDCGQVVKLLEGLSIIDGEAGGPPCQTALPEGFEGGRGRQDGRSKKGR